MSVLIQLKPKQKTKSIVFKDVDITNVMHHNSNINIQSIRNRIRNIFEWQQGTRILDPEFGNILEKIKYEELNEVTLMNADGMIRKMLAYEPEIRIIDIVLIPDYDQNELKIQLECAEFV